jgi:SAM-dependent methyltransferase
MRTDRIETAPPDPALAIREHYIGESGRRYHEAGLGIPDIAFPWVTRARVRKIAPFVRPDSVVVEFGVGHGWNLAALQCRTRIGFDLGVQVAPVVRRHGITFVERSASIESNSADVLICHHVLEHVPSPVDTLAELRRMLAPEGRLLLFVPYEFERRNRRYLAQEPNHHLFSWTPQTLGNLVTDCGFLPSSVGIGPYGYDRVAAVWAARLRLGEAGFHVLRRLALTLRPVREVRLVAAKRGA